MRKQASSRTRLSKNAQLLNRTSRINLHIYSIRHAPSQSTQRKIDVEGAEIIEGGPVGDEGLFDVKTANEDEGLFVVKAANDEGQDNAETVQEAQPEDQLEGDLVTDALMLKVTLDILKLFEQRYKSRDKIFNWSYPRMLCVEVVIHTWVLKFANIIPSPYNTDPNTWAEFRPLCRKADHQKLNDAEWAKFKAVFLGIADKVLRTCDVVIATAIQAQTELLKNIVFQQGVIDEISIATHGEMLCAWRSAESLTLIGDGKQLPSTVLTTTAQNSFAMIQGFGPFQRWSELCMPVFLLKEVMRLTAGIEDISNTIVYGSKLVRGPGTSLDSPHRELSKKLLAAITNSLPLLHPEPEGLTYPVFFDIRGNYLQEPNGTSRINGYNISFTIAWIKSMLEG